MKLKKIKLHPFAGIKENEFSFSDGLNVLLGPNEIGKSTLFNAVLNGLLTTTSLTEKQLEDTMGRFFPALGGDVIRTDITLENSDGNEIQIKKRWKKGTRQGSASLHLADGTEITDEETVQQKIEEMLPVSAATLRTILLADQSALHHTIRNMTEEDDVRKELGNLLRRNLMETGGVSVDRFRDLLEQKYEDYFKRWDRDQDYPEKGRGINNPFKVGTGKVVDAYYQKEQLSLDLKEARQFEKDLDELNQKLTGFTEKHQGKKGEYNRLNPLKEGIRQKQLKEQNLETLKERKINLLDISKKWPVYENQIENLEPKRKEYQEAIDKLDEEFKTAKNVDKADQLKKKIEKIEKLAKDVKEATSELKDANKIEDGDVKKLRGLSSDINNLKAALNAARLTVRVKSESDRTVRYTEAGKEEENVDLKSGKKVEKTASGGFILQSDGLRVEVFSGEGNLENTIKDVEKKEGEFKKLLMKLDVDSLQSAESFAELYKQKMQEVKNAENLYNSELSEDKLEDLKTDLKNYGDLEGVRSIEEINKELIDTKTKLNGLNEQAREAEKKLKEWKEKYDDLDSVLVKMGDTSSDIKRVEKELKDLPDLPEGYETPEEFIEKVESLGEEIKHLDGQINDLKIEKAGMEGGAPETSSEELVKMLEDAEMEFERIHQEAETLANVRERSWEMLESLDSETYSGLETSFTGWLNKMTGNRFASVQLNEDLPQIFNTNDDRPLTYNLLSHGTKDTVALAWRFALTEHFLKEQSGFIILDDPMVDMDPERRKLASEAIEEFAKEQQVLVLTCHPEHVSLIKKKSSIVELL
ncbi:MAG: AAA family ATPase [Candidatus Paceibacterota bacterium]